MLVNSWKKSKIPAARGSRLIANYVQSKVVYLASLRESVGAVTQTIRHALVWDSRDKMSCVSPTLGSADYQQPRHVSVSGRGNLLHHAGRGGQEELSVMKKPREEEEDKCG